MNLNNRIPYPLQTAPGKFPKLTTTLRAEALATLLAGEDVSDMASVFASGSTKLATVMRALSRRYRWPIERKEFATNLPDGRVAWVSTYTLPPASIESAFDIGAEAWIEEVRAVRSKRRAARNAAFDFEEGRFRRAPQSSMSARPLSLGDDK